MTTLQQILAEQEDRGIIKFQGMAIRVENPVGSIRRGKDRKTGKRWATQMRYPYGEIVNSMGVDGDPVDVFVGPERNAKFAYVIHQLKPNTGEWDEDKCFLGFLDIMEAKQAYFWHYDHPEQFFGSIDAIPMDKFKEAVLRTKKHPQMIRAGSRLFSLASLYHKVGE